MKFFKQYPVAVVVLVLAIVFSCGVMWMQQPEVGSGDPARLPAGEQTYVQDGAEALSPVTVQVIQAVNLELKEKTGGEIYVISVASLGASSVSRQARSLFEVYDVGDRGMLLLFSPSEDAAEIACGAQVGGLSGKQYLDRYFRDDADGGQYDLAVQKLFGALVRWYEGRYKVVISSNPWTVDEDGAHNYDYDGLLDTAVSLVRSGGRMVSRAIRAVVVLVVVALVVVVFLVWRLLFRRKGGETARNKRQWSQTSHQPPPGPGPFSGSGQSGPGQPPPGPGPFPGVDDPPGGTGSGSGPRTGPGSGPAGGRSSSSARGGQTPGGRSSSTSRNR